MKKLLLVSLLVCNPAFCAYEGYILFNTVPSKAGATATSPYSLLISGTYTSLATVANGGKVRNTVPCGVNSIACPADLLFAKDSSCTMPFTGWDVFVYSPVTGNLTASVEIPILSNTTPVAIYACVGNSSVTTWQGGIQGAAYDIDYMLSLHMEENSGTVLHDSTRYANNAIRKAAGSPSPVPTGITGAAQSFLGTANSAGNDYAVFNSLTPATNTYTIEYWTNAASYINLDSVFLESSTGAPTVFTGFYWFPAGTVVYRNSYNGSTQFTPATTAVGSFHYLAFVRNGDSMNLYVDGIPGTAQSGFGSGTEQWKGLGWDGGADVIYNSFNGVLDEVSYSRVARSPDYLTARFNNYSNPGAFYTVSAFTTISTVPPVSTNADSEVTVF